MNLNKKIEICLKDDNMHIFVTINALICINNYVITCINSMLSAPTRLTRKFIIYIVYIMGIQPSIYRKGIQPLKMSPFINPFSLYNFFHVGLKSHTVYFKCRNVA